MADIFEINEPLSEYFKSEKFLKSFKKLTVSSFEEMELDNLRFNAMLRPAQRLELLKILNDRFFDLKNIETNTVKKLKILKPDEYFL